MVANLKISFLIWFFLLIGMSYCASAAPNPNFEVDKLTDNIVSQFNQLLDYNKQNDLNGESHKNRYVLHYLPGQSFSAAISGVDYVQQHTFNNDDWALNWPNTDGMGNTDLEDELCDFNGNVNSKNIFNIRKYAILFGLPTNAYNTLLSSDLPSQSAIINYMDGTSADINKTLFLGVEQLIEDKIRNDLNGSAIDGAQEKVITVSSYYVYKRPWTAQTFQGTKTRTFFIQSSTLTASLFNEYIAYSNAISDTYSEQKFTGKFYQRIKGFVDFFENPTSYNLDYDACSLGFTHTKTIEVRDCYCGSAGSISQKEFLTNVCLFIDNNHVYTGSIFILNPLIGNSFDCPMPTSSWINTIVQEFYTYDTANPGSDALTWLLQEKIMTPTVANVDIESVLYWYASASILDFRNLSATERFKLIAVTKHNFPSGTSSTIYSNYGGEASMTNRLYETIYTGTYMTPEDGLTFLNQLSSESGMMKWFFEKVSDNWLTWESDEHKVIRAFNALTTHVNGGAPNIFDNFLVDWGNDGVIWKPTPWWWDFAGHYNYDNLDISNNSECTFRQRYITSSTQISNYFIDTTWIVEDPFLLIPVGGSTDVTWATDCDNGGNGVIGCGKVAWIPTFSLVWYMEKLNDGQTFDALVAAAEVALLALGVGEFMILMRVAGGVATTALKARRVLYGFSIAADIADLALPNVVAYVAQMSGVDGLRANQIKTQIRSVTGILAAVGGVAQITDLFVGLAKYRRVKSVLGNPETDVQKVMDDVVNMLSQYPEYTTKLCQKMGITNATALNKIEGIADLTHRTAVIGAIRQTDEIKAAVQANPNLVDFLKVTLADGVNADIHKILLNLDDAQYLKLLQDLDSGDMIAAFTNNLELLKAWKAVKITDISNDLDWINVVKKLIDDQV